MAVGTVKIIDTVKVNGRDVGKLYNAPNGTFLRGLDFNTDWEYFGTKDVNGRRWYDLGGDQWISDEFASHAIKEVGVATGTCRVANFSSDFKATVRNVPNGIPNGQKLDPNTEWAYNEYAIDQWGYKWFNLGHSQWATTQEVVDITNGGSSSGKWQFPFAAPYNNANGISGEQLFGYTRQNWTHTFHDGVDFGTGYYLDRQIRAVHSGTIILAGEITPDQYLGWTGNDMSSAIGNHIILLRTDDGYDIVYQEFAAASSLGDISVTKGQRVNAGDIIGYLDAGAYNGVTGNSSVSHVHIGVCKGTWANAVANGGSFKPSTWVDPLTLFTA